jgi:hypothetical protein
MVKETCVNSAWLRVYTLDVATLQPFHIWVMKDHGVLHARVAVWLDCHSLVVSHNERRRERIAAKRAKL